MDLAFPMTSMRWHQDYMIYQSLGQCRDLPMVYAGYWIESWIGVHRANRYSLSKVRFVFAKLIMSLTQVGYVIYIA